MKINPNSNGRSVVAIKNRSAYVIKDIFNTEKLVTVFMRIYVLNLTLFIN